MNIYHSIIAFVASATLFASCDDYLDIKPKGQLLPETAADYETLLNYPQLLKASEVYPNYMTDDVYLPQEAYNDYAPGLSTESASTNNLYTFQPDIFGDAEEDPLWFESYNRIYYYNVVVTNVMNATEATDTEKRALKAEALLGRAFEYLNLVNGYAKQYNAETAATDLGVPLVLNEDIAQENLQRASVKEVYEQILADLDEAAKDLPEKVKFNNHRASKSVGLGMLARTYLYMGDYQNALKYANESMAQNNQLLNLTAYSVVNPNAAIGRINVPSGADNVENIYIRYAPRVYGLSGSVFGSDDLLSLFTENDKRLQLYFSDMLYGIIPLPRKIWLPFVRANQAMTTPEMYLIAAECEARIGSVANAMKLLNKLRDNRIVDNTPIETTDKDEALKIVLEERRRELTMQGLMRLIDLKRLNTDSRFAKTITHEGDGKTYTLAPNSPRYVLPIPNKVLRFNPDMKQNDRD